jgi:alpha-mannosidase
MIQKDTMNLFRPHYLFHAFVLSIQLLPVVNAAETTLWQIGKLDDSGKELADGEAWFYRGQPRPVEFRVGESDAKSDWPDFHPSTHQPTGGAREHPFKILFTLKEPPSGTYLLKVRTFINRPYYPDLQVEINGHRGVFALHPVPISISSAYWKIAANNLVLATADVDAMLPTEYLRQGENTLTLTAIRGTHLQYDALRLTRSDSAPTGMVRDARLHATGLFRSTPGEPEVVELRVQTGAIDGSLPYRIGIGEFDARGTLSPSGQAFGELAATIEVPTTPGETLEATIEIGSGGTAQSFRSAFQSAKRWTVYSAPTIHDDVGYRETQPRTRATMENAVDDVLAVCEKHPWYRFHLESAWTASLYLSHHSGPSRAKFLHAVKNKVIGVNGIYANMETSAMSAEELARAFYTSSNLHRSLGLEFNTAVQGDQPTSTGALPTFLAGAGIKYFVESSNQARAPLFRNAALAGEVPLNMRSPYYWEGPDGSRVLMWSGVIYAQLARLVFGHPRHDAEYAVLPRTESENLNTLRKSLPLFLKHYEAYGYPYDAVLLYGGFGDDHNFGDGEAPIVEKWNATYAFPKIHMAHISEFFEEIKTQKGGEIPVIRGDMGAYWGDGYASTPLEAAWAREAQRLLPASEKFGTIAALIDPRLEFSLEESNGNWEKLLQLDEHTWGDEFTVRWPHSERQTLQQTWKRDFARAAVQQSRWTLQHCLEQLRVALDIPYETTAVFNPLSWARSGPVEIDMPEGNALIDPTTGDIVPHAVVGDENGNHRSRFWANDVPALGYRVYQIRPRKREKRPANTELTVEGKYYRVTINDKTGSIASIHDRRLDRELVDTASPHGFNEYTYVTGGDGSSIASQFQKEAILSVDHPRAKSIETFREPWGVRVVVHASMPLADVRSDISIFDTEPRIDIVNTLNKEKVYHRKESTYFAFPFATKNPDFAYRQSAGWYRPNLDQVPGAAKEWFMVQDGVRIRDGDKSVVWVTRDAPVVAFQDLVRGKWPVHLELENGWIFSWVTNNYWFTNWPPAQGGKLTFRYSLTTDATIDQTDATRFGFEVRSPLIPLVSRAQIEPPFGSRGAVPNPVDTQIELSPRNVVLLNLKPAEVGSGFIARLQEIGGQATMASLRIKHLQTGRATACNLVEEDQGPLAIKGGVVSVPMRANGIATVRLER